MPSDQEAPELGDQDAEQASEPQNPSGVPRRIRAHMRLIGVTAAAVVAAASIVLGTVDFSPPAPTQAPSHVRVKVTGEPLRLDRHPDNNLIDGLGGSGLYYRGDVRTVLTNPTSEIANITLVLNRPGMMTYKNWSTASRSGCGTYARGAVNHLTLICTVVPGEHQTIDTQYEVTDGPAKVGFDVVTWLPGYKTERISAAPGSVQYSTEKAPVHGWGRGLGN